MSRASEGELRFKLQSSLGGWSEEEGDDPEAKPFVHHANDEDNQPSTRPLVRPPFRNKALPALAPRTVPSNCATVLGHAVPPLPPSYGAMMLRRQNRQ